MRSTTASQAFPPWGWTNLVLGLSLYVLCTSPLTIVATLSLTHSSLPCTGGPTVLHMQSHLCWREEKYITELTDRVLANAAPSAADLHCRKWVLPRCTPQMWRFPQLFCWSGCVWSWVTQLALSNTTSTEELWQLLVPEDLAPSLLPLTLGCPKLTPWLSHPATILALFCSGRSFPPGLYFSLTAVVQLAQRCGPSPTGVLPALWDTEAWWEREQQYKAWLCFQMLPAKGPQADWQLSRGRIF